ncbi:MAG: protein kinase domain-containing protein [Prochlorotrichaceae cyanobacterium]
MQPAIPSGTVLQNRYHILQILGQGGFGRTYLAEDRGRFDELCAIKEYISPKSGAYALEKSKELFEREASVLYQIQHPQVPQFRAVFEENDRFFLIQDYVAGQTYSELLSQRTSMESSFSSSEVTDFLRQLLPVLVHIHDRGIIHRDISPDNIILRDRDQMPVLIDFGVVKAAIMSNFKPTPPGQRTTVGKIGYAPSEQVQMGQAYPSSDLYSLGVTAAVLLTGKQPNTLKDKPGQWIWKRYATATDPLLLSVIDRLVELRPGDRYQSARDVLVALGETPPASDLPATVLPTEVRRDEATPSVNLFQAQTAGDDRPPETRPEVPPHFPSPTTPTEIRSRDPFPSPRQSVPSVSHPTPPSSFLDDPVAVIAAGLSIVALAGIGSWAIVRMILVQEPEIESPPTPSPLIVEVGGTPIADFPTSPPTPVATVQSNQPISYQQPIVLLANQPQRFERRLTQYETQTYSFPASRGQTLSAFIAGEGILMTIAAPDQQPIDERSDRVSQWEGTLPQDGTYSIILKPVEGLRQAGYSLELVLNDPPATAASPSSNSPQYREQNISIPAGAAPTTLTGEVSPRDIQRYWINLRTGDTLEAQIIAGSAQMTLFNPRGGKVAGANQVRSFDFTIPASGLYSIEVSSSSPSVFGLNLAVTAPSTPRPVSTPTPTSTPAATPTPPSPTPTPTPSPTQTPTPSPQNTVTIVPALPSPGSPTSTAELQG